MTQKEKEKFKLAADQKTLITIPDSLSQWLSQPKSHYIDGRWSKDNTQLFSSVNPATGKEVSQIAIANQAQVEQAVHCARQCFERAEWANYPIARRREILRALGDKILEHQEELAILESIDTGKPIAESYFGDIARAASNFHFFADYVLSDEMPSYPNEQYFHYAVREPLGVIALITPWNLPLYLETWKIAPCLLMGNCAILKPSELTPLTATYFTELLSTLDLPPGAFQLLHGHGENSTGEFLSSHAGVDAISFTGETTTGKAIMAKAAPTLKRLSFELGGKGATVLFEDADLDSALTECLRSGFRNQGEICLACPRIFVHQSHYSLFVEKLVERAKAIRVGNPLDFSTQMGALVGEQHWNKVLGYLGEKSDPAKIHCGGIRPSEQPDGFFIEPTVISDAPLDHPISQEEIFGPVVSLYPFESEQQVIDHVNSTPYGLSASIWTNNLDRAHRVSKKIRSGLVWINCWFVRDLRVPFGGQKASGIGREGGKHSLDFYSEWKSICLKTESK